MLILGFSAYGVRVPLKLRGLRLFKGKVDF